MSTNIPSSDPIHDLPVTDTDRVYDLIDEHADTLDLSPPVVKTIIDLFGRAYERTSLAGRGSIVGVAAAVRVACQLHDEPRSISEIAAVTDAKEKLIARESQKIQHVTGEHTTPTDAQTYLDHWTDKLDADTETRHNAADLLNEVHFLRTPAAAAAGALWAALASQNDRNINQEDIVRETHTSAYTLRKVQSDIDSG
ncbi:transcription initiation factor IIB family protein [Halopenitus persicus]|uniref:Transcription factor TFIIB repeat-containing protein n=1 Tax=Halopenitus persicus TaxID=1048396 RepID=A0A1H3NT32_9EURY|nr:hypothetical protein [Halopenitus persicus]SDY91958.1 Transcription factor TFIIB repeat-containing protein [Halopenitus persicus]